MKTVKTSEFSGLALDWAVAQAMGMQVEIGAEYIVDANRCVYAPSGSWVICGEFVEKYSIELVNELIPDEQWGGRMVWSASCNYVQDGYEDGETPRIAICRAVVAVKMGREVSVPEELLK